MSTTLTIQRLSGFGRGKTEQFSEQRIVLGKSPTCHMRFDPTWDKTVSPEHAVLSLHGDGWWLEDQSLEGCWVDGRRVSQIKLSTGTIVSLGQGGPKIQVGFEPVGLAETPQEVPPAAICAAVVTKEVSPVDSPSRKPAWLLWAAGVVGGVVLLLVLLAVIRHKDTDQQLAEMAKRYEDAVGVVIVVDQKDGTAVSVPVATAWAIGEKVFVSNSHLSQSVSEEIDKGRSVFIVLNKHPEKKFQILRVVVHPRYAETNYNIEDKNLAVPAYDVGLLYVDGVVPNRFTVAPESELRKLDSGYRVAYLGFPTENMTGGGVDLLNPVANMQSGILTSVTDYWLSKAPFDRALLLAHNLGATGGASGSPVFNSSGQVVGILSVGNITGQVKVTGANEVSLVRAPSAVMINFAQRIDVLRDIYPEFPK